MIRPATPDDVPAINQMVRDLAEYEKSLHEVKLTEERLKDALFGDSPAAFAHVAESDGAVVGFALWFLSFSTWTGTHGIYLEDLYVQPGARGGGHGKALMTELARIGVERGYERFEWSVLDWNRPTIDFYRSIGAEPCDDWIRYRLSGEPLRSFADQSR
ncbi:GNAT family N-acetyltransferase [Nonomuraea sp. SBT364]|uniref:GNAT family N-acetyltransferase n=1 Tax=Nonomuraea sp. SBT364 TaxID=1580530 RepID=UPI0007C7444D|nr:GNAT family N-acetyltransferase [Nonomuraea sp. SBT364]